MTPLVTSVEMDMHDMCRESERTRGTIQRWLKAGLPHHRIEVGGTLHIRVKRVDFEAWLPTVKAAGRPKKVTHGKD